MGGLLTVWRACLGILLTVRIQSDAIKLTKRNVPISLAINTLKPTSLTDLLSLFVVAEVVPALAAPSTTALEAPDESEGVVLSPLVLEAFSVSELEGNGVGAGDELSSSSRFKVSTGVDFAAAAEFAATAAAASSSLDETPSFLKGNGSQDPSL